MKYNIPHTVKYYHKATGIEYNCVHFDLRVPKGTIIVVGHVLCNELNSGNSSSRCMVIRKLYRNNKIQSNEWDSWHIYCSMESRSLNKLRNKYNVLCAGSTENGKIPWDILCSRRHTQGNVIPECSGGLF